VTGHNELGVSDRSQRTDGQRHSGRPISILFSELSAADINDSSSHLFRLFVGNSSTVVIESNTKPFGMQMLSFVCLLGRIIALKE
jgi:hypothetical protein